MASYNESFSKLSDSLPEGSCIGCAAFGQCDQCNSCITMGTCELNDIPSIASSEVVSLEEPPPEQILKYEHFNNDDNNVLDSIKNTHLIIAAIAAVTTYVLYYRGYFNNRNFMVIYITVLALIASVVLMPESVDRTWKSPSALKSLNKLKNKYGPPTIMQGKLAIWTEDQLMDTCFSRIEVRDEEVFHSNPTEHNDHTYHYINYDVTPEHFLDVTSLTGALVYDPLTKELRSRCNSENHNIATLALATQLGEGNVTLNFAHNNDMYRSWLESTSKSKNVKKLYDLLCYNITNQTGNPLPEGYWPLALPQTDATPH